jgi:hypothetical protein
MDYNSKKPIHLSKIQNKMKNLYLLLLPVLFVLGSCSTEKAEAVADEFHAKFDSEELDYIAENLLDTEATEDETQGFIDFLNSVRSEGKPENREKEMGFSKKTSGGVTTVRLNYNFDLNGEKIYEGLVLIDRGDGYKVHIVSMHPDKSVADSYVAEY